MKTKLITLCLLGAVMASCGTQPSLKVISFNVRTSVKDDGANSWEFRKPASKAMLDEERPDIFGVQEAQPDQLAYIASECPDYIPFGEGRDGGEEGEHAAIFYNRNVLELVDGGTWWLSETPDTVSRGWDAKYPRTATWGLMEDLRNGKQFYFVNTHLDHKGAQARKNGLKLIVEKTRGMNPEIPLILTGDFNVQPGDECLDALAGKLQDARAVAKVTSEKASSNSYGRSFKIIDYIFFAGFRGADKFDVLDKEYAGIPYISDHYPIVATLIY